jgi:CRP-like cAMP-binding protein
MDGLDSARGFWNLLTEREQTGLTGLGSTRDFRPGVIMCHEGDLSTYLYVLISGWVKIMSVTSEGQERVQALRGNGEVVGEAAAVVDGRRTATLKAVDLVHVLTVRHERFNAFLAANPRVAEIYRTAITLRLNDTAILLSRQSVTSGAQRLALHLLALAERHGTEAGGVIDVDMPLSQEELASLAGASRATVTRALGEWRRRGIVRTAPRRVTIIDPASLRQIADRRG